MIQRVIQLVDPFFSIVVFAQLRFRQANAGFLCEHLDLLLDELHDLTSKLLLPSQNTPPLGEAALFEMGASCQGLAPQSGSFDSHTVCTVSNTSPLRATILFSN
jgi:hypothetical protein